MQEIWATGGDVGFTRDGSHAEYVVIPKQAARPKPQNLSFNEAACVGRTYVTAYVGLIEKAQLQEGETVLVTGASGGVGSSVAKLAKTKSARVIGVDLQAPDPDTARQAGDRSRPQQPVGRYPRSSEAVHAEKRRKCGL